MRFFKAQLSVRLDDLDEGVYDDRIMVGAGEHLSDGFILQDEGGILFNHRPILEERSDVLVDRGAVGVMNLLKQALLLRIIFDHAFDPGEGGDAVLVVAFKRLELIFRSRKEIAVLDKPD